MSGERRTVTLRVYFVYEYETCPADYPEGQRDPFVMAQLDLETDPAIMFDNDGLIERVEVDDGTAR